MHDTKWPGMSVTAPVESSLRVCSAIVIHAMKFTYFILAANCGRWVHSFSLHCPADDNRGEFLTDPSKIMQILGSAHRDNWDVRRSVLISRAHSGIYETLIFCNSNHDETGEIDYAWSLYRHARKIMRRFVCSRKCRGVVEVEKNRTNVFTAQQNDDERRERCEYSSQPRTWAGSPSARRSKNMKRSYIRFCSRTNANRIKS